VRSALIAALLFVVPTGADVQTNPLRGAGRRPVEPFRIAGNVYYVGAQGISAFLIETSEGLILLDTGTAEMSEGQRANICALGHELADVRIILSSHAHWDHVEGHAAMQEATGARVLAVGDDVAAIASGEDSSAIGGPGWTSVAVDETLADGARVTLGDVTMLAHLTAGHTSIADGYARTFAVLKGLNPDVWVGQHPDMFGMAGKRNRLAGDPASNPFVDPDGYRAFVAGQEATFLEQLADERAQQGTAVGGGAR